MTNEAFSQEKIKSQKVLILILKHWGLFPEKNLTLKLVGRK